MDNLNHSLFPPTALGRQDDEKATPGQRWADFSRVRTTSNFLNVLWSPSGEAVTPKCLSSPPVDRNRLNAHPGSIVIRNPGRKNDIPSAAQVPPSGVETEGQSYLRLLVFHLYGASPKRDTSSRGKYGLQNPSGQGIGSWQACHEFDPSTT
ncbi:hypothetical protein TNCV_76091 [Trichonephila clavipes]|nr:hypothetical protein TNCV_76091 [Trichonephila clavipes]